MSVSHDALVVVRVRVLLDGAALSTGLRREADEQERMLEAGPRDVRLEPRMLLDVLEPLWTIVAVA